MLFFRVFINEIICSRSINTRLNASISNIIVNIIELIPISSFLTIIITNDNIVAHIMPTSFNTNNSILSPLFSFIVFPFV